MSDRLYTREEMLKAMKWSARTQASIIQYGFYNEGQDLFDVNGKVKVTFKEDLSVDYNIEPPRKTSEEFDDEDDYFEYLDCVEREDDRQLSISDAGNYTSTYSNTEPPFQDFLSINFK